nr:MAG TPA_asm: hypothetical protein [Caudoviricetes sp.]
MRFCFSICFHLQVKKFVDNFVYFLKKIFSFSVRDVIPSSLQRISVSLFVKSALFLHFILKYCLEIPSFSAKYPYFFPESLILCSSNGVSTIPVPPFFLLMFLSTFNTITRVDIFVNNIFEKC